MRRALLAGLLTLALAHLAPGQSNYFINNQVITYPPDNVPQGWALNYVNNNSINLTTGVLVNFYDAQNFTNRGSMVADVGFLINSTPSSGGPTVPLASFDNASSTATISAGAGLAPPFRGVVTTNTTTNAPPLVPQMKILATNFHNAGLIDVAVNGLLKIDATNANLTRGTLNIEGFDNSVTPTSPEPPFGIYDRQWGSGSNTLTANNFKLPSPASPQITSTNTTGGTTSDTVSPASPMVFMRQNVISPSNAYYQVIFVSDTGTAHPVIDGGFGTQNANFVTAVVHWNLSITNSFGEIISDDLYLEDTMGAAATNSPGVSSNQFTQSGQPLYAPTNYTFLTTSAPSYNPTTNFTNLNESGILGITNAFPTNQPNSLTGTFIRWGVDLLPVTFQPDPLNPNQSYSNIPGRMLISANQLDLTRTRITGPNYVSLTASNFVGSASARMVFPVSDLNLGNASNMLIISNLVVPFVARPLGPIDAWSTRWTNIYSSNTVTTNFTTNGGTATTNVVTNSFQVTNGFEVLMVVSAFSNSAAPYQEHVTFHSSNVMVSDTLNISTNFLSDAVNFTISTNAGSTPGAINLLSTAILWQPSLPNLLNFTNWGVLTIGNSTFFEHLNSSDSPFPGDSPYTSFVNHGQIASSGANIIWANNFVDVGFGTNQATISSETGQLVVQSSTAVMANGEMDAVNYGGDMAITTGSLNISNFTLLGVGEMFLTVTNTLTDGGTIGNYWEFEGGIWVPIKPASGDLLGTEIWLDALSNSEPDIIWPGVDKGPTLAGYTNNVVVGNLVLDSFDVTSAFHFAAASGPNAIYIDRLDLTGPATVANVFDIDPNMTIYFAKAFRNGTNISGTLNGAFGGRIQQVPGFVGPFTVPAITQGNVVLSITVTNQPSGSPMISWNAIPNANNGLYYSANPFGGNWTLVTNIVEGATASKVTVHDTTTPTNSARFYKLIVTPTGQ